MSQSQLAPGRIARQSKFKGREGSIQLVETPYKCTIESLTHFGDTILQMFTNVRVCEEKDNKTHHVKEQ